MVGSDWELEDDILHQDGLLVDGRTPPFPCPAMPKQAAWTGAPGDTSVNPMEMAAAGHVHPSGRQEKHASTLLAGTYTWTFDEAFPAGVVPTVQVVAVATAGSTDVINVQLDGEATNTQAKFRVTRTQQSVVALLGLTILSIPASVGVTPLHMTASYQP